MGHQHGGGQPAQPPYGVDVMGRGRDVSICKAEAILLRSEVSGKRTEAASGCLAEQLHPLHLQNWAEESKACNFLHSLF